MSDELVEDATNIIATGSACERLCRKGGACGCESDARIIINLAHRAGASEALERAAKWHDMRAEINERDAELASIAHSYDVSDLIYYATKHREYAAAIRALKGE